MYPRDPVSIWASVLFSLRALVGNEAIRIAQEAKDNLRADAIRITRYQCTPRVLRPAAHDHHPYKSGRTVHLVDIHSQNS